MSDFASSGPLSDRINAARRDVFVGRAAEIEVFEATLRSFDDIIQASQAIRVLHVCGPGGIGKTTLLRAFGWACRRRNIDAVTLDGRLIEPTPESFSLALHQAGGLTPSAETFALTKENRSPLFAGNGVLLLDNFEHLAPLDTWLREVFLPSLPECSLVVFAGRHTPSLEWRSDAGWRSLVRVLQLRNFSPSESDDYLLRRDYPPQRRRAALRWTHGHPLALSLIADLHRAAPLPAETSAEVSDAEANFRPEEAPDLIQTLLHKLVEQVPGPQHRAALEACALMRTTTQTLLAHLLNQPDVGELFDWLRGLSFMEPAERGLQPHDLAREVLAADLRWRDPEDYALLHQRAREFYRMQLARVEGHEQQRLLFDYIYLHRTNPLVHPFFEWSANGALSPGPLRAEDVSILCDITLRHEGEASSRLAAHWLGRQPQGALVVREASGHIAGFLLWVSLREATPEDRALDPAVDAALSYLERHEPMRGNEDATMFRFWMARDEYQSVSAVQSLLFVHMARYYLTTPRLAFTFLPCADPGFYAAVFDYAAAKRLEEADFSVGERRYGVHGHDWRATPPLSWLDLLGERELAVGPLPPAPRRAPLIVLSHAEFCNGVRDALRDWNRIEALRHNVLLRSRLVWHVAQSAQPHGTSSAISQKGALIAALRSLVQKACESLRGTPRTDRLYRALDLTYLHPARSQEQAAESLDVPFSTFRRHLKAGMTRVANDLWEQELNVEDEAGRQS